ncbi:MAG: hypothetical protein WD751_00135 [Anaerolineales bacterium]
MKPANVGLVTGMAAAEQAARSIDIRIKAKVFVFMYRSVAEACNGDVNPKSEISNHKSELPLPPRWYNPKHH